MSGRQLPVGEQTLHGRWESQEPQTVGDGRATLAHPRRHLIVREAEVIDQLLICRRFLEGSEILTMQVLDQRLLDRAHIVGHTNHRGNGGQPRSLRGSPPALSGNQLVGVVVEWPDEDRLEHAHLGDRCGQLTQALLIEEHARLVWVRGDGRDGNVGQDRCRGSSVTIRAFSRRDDRTQPLAQTTRSCHGAPPVQRLDRRSHPERWGRTS